jgi:hypothetical protein
LWYSPTLALIMCALCVRSDTFATKVSLFAIECKFDQRLTVLPALCAGQFRDGVFNGRGTRIYAGTRNAALFASACARLCAAQVLLVPAS